MKDVVCGMTIYPQNAGAKSEYKGQTYYFCSRGCKAAFDKNPDKFTQVGQDHEQHAGHHH